MEPGDVTPGAEGGGPTSGVSDQRGWTIETFVSHTAEVRRLEELWAAERDRRYSEVALEREKALKIKETADLTALRLAREIQTYKDEKANELREQIAAERGLYVTKGELTSAVEKMAAEMKPLAEYVAQERGSQAGALDMRMLLFAIIGAAGVVVGVVAFITR